MPRPRTRIKALRDTWNLSMYAEREGQQALSGTIERAVGCIESARRDNEVIAKVLGRLFDESFNAPEEVRAWWVETLNEVEEVEEAGDESE